MATDQAAIVPLDPTAFVAGTAESFRSLSIAGACADKSMYVDPAYRTLPGTGYAISALGRR